MSLSRIGTIVSTGITDFITRYGINNVMLIGVDFVSRAWRIGDALAPETRGFDANTDRKHDCANAIGCNPSR